MVSAVRDRLPAANEKWRLAQVLARSDSKEAHDALLGLLAYDEESQIVSLQALRLRVRREDGSSVLNLLRRTGSTAVKKEACLFLGRGQGPDGDQGLDRPLATARARTGQAGTPSVAKDHRSAARAGPRAVGTVVESVGQATLTQGSPPRLSCCATVSSAATLSGRSRRSEPRPGACGARARAGLDLDQITAEAKNRYGL